MKVYIKTEKIVLKFGHTDIKKYKFLQYKRPVSIINKDISKIMILNKVKKVLNISWATKMLKNRPLMIFLPEMSVEEIIK